MSSTNAYGTQPSSGRPVQLRYSRGVHRVARVGQTPPRVTTAAIRVLGPVEVVGGDGPVALAAKPRCAARGAVGRGRRLAHGRTSSSRRCGDPATPPSARKLVQVYVSQLRRSLPAQARIVTGAGGYALEAPPELVDAVAFQRLVEESAAARRDGNHVLALSLAAQASRLWRGRAVRGPGIRRLPPARDRATGGAAAGRPRGAARRAARARSSRGRARRDPSPCRGEPAAGAAAAAGDARALPLRTPVGGAGAVRGPAPAAGRGARAATRRRPAGAAAADPPAGPFPRGRSRHRLPRRRCPSRRTR